MSFILRARDIQTFGLTTVKRFRGLDFRDSSQSASTALEKKDHWIAQTMKFKD